MGKIGIGLFGWFSTFPSSSRRGGCAINKTLRSILNRADGVVRNRQQNSVGIYSPPRPLHKGRFAIFLMMSRPPLLEEEGKSSQDHDFLRRQNHVSPRTPQTCDS